MAHKFFVGYVQDKIDRLQAFLKFLKATTVYDISCNLDILTYFLFMFYHKKKSMKLYKGELQSFLNFKILGNSQNLRTLLEETLGGPLSWSEIKSLFSSHVFAAWEKCIYGMGGWTN